MSYTLVVYSPFDRLPSFVVLDNEADKERIAKLKQFNGKVVNDDEVQSIVDICEDANLERLPETVTIPTGTYTDVINVGWS